MYKKLQLSKTSPVGIIRSIAITLLLFSAIFSSSCSKSTDLSSLVHYPTQFQVLNSTEYSNRLSAYASRNPLVRSSIDNYGFCGGSAEYNWSLPSPAKAGYITENEAIDAVKEFIDKNPVETGIKDSRKVTFIRKIQFWTIDSSCVWNIFTGNQLYNSKEVLSTDFAFRVENGVVNDCTGHWFPEIYIPGSFKFTSKMAIYRLVGIDDGLWGWGGYSSHKLTQTELQNAKSSVVIMPVTVFSRYDPRIEESIELHVVYKIESESPNIYYVDVMDGKILGIESTVVSLQTN